MPVTIKDIAREAKVSHSTVSRALNNNPLIPEETAKRIRKVAVKMGYLPKRTVINSMVEIEILKLPKTI